MHKIAWAYLAVLQIRVESRASVTVPVTIKHEKRAKGFPQQLAPVEGGLFVN